jgi:DNA-binding ferritin-like protein
LALKKPLQGQRAVVVFVSRGHMQNAQRAEIDLPAERLAEYPLDPGGSLPHVEAQAERFAALAATTRSAIRVAEEEDDASTADLFTEVSRGLDKSLWFLEAHLQA